MRQVMLFVLCLLAGLAQADSLYAPRSGFRSLYSDRKAVTIGDVIHIVVTEAASASQSNADATDVSTDAKIGPGLGKLSFLPLWGYGGSATSGAKGSATRSDTLTARLAVTVVGIAPNGNLLVEGERLMQVHKDFQTLKVSGEVRPQDVAADSSVPSYKVANIRLAYTGSNPSRPGSKTGIISRLLHYLF